MLLSNGRKIFWRNHAAILAGEYCLCKHRARRTAGRFPKRNNRRTRTLLTARPIRAPLLEEFYVSAIGNSDQIRAQNISGA